MIEEWRLKIDDKERNRDRGIRRKRRRRLKGIANQIKILSLSLSQYIISSLPSVPV